MVLPRGTLDRLLRHTDADMVGGLIRSTRNSTILEAGWARNLSADPLRPTDHPDFHAIFPAANLYADGSPPFTVDFLGAGCLLVHRRVFTQVEPPWFVPNQSELAGQNEDWNFVIRAGAAGCTVLCDPSIKLTQLTVMGVRP